MVWWKEFAPKVKSGIINLYTSKSAGQWVCAAYAFLNRDCTWRSRAAEIYNRRPESPCSNSTLYILLTLTLSGLISAQIWQPPRCVVCEWVSMNWINIRVITAQTKTNGRRVLHMCVSNELLVDCVKKWIVVTFAACSNIPSVWCRLSDLQWIKLNRDLVTQKLAATNHWFFI